MSELTPLLDACVPLLAERDDALAREFAQLLQTVRLTPPHTEPSGGFPLGRFPDLGSSASETTRPVVDATSALQERITWFQSAADRVPPGWRERSGACELIAPSGMIHDDARRFGLFFIEPGTHYPDHWHAAEEFYVVVAGAAEWTLDGRSIGPQVPGSYVRTPTMVRHAITTTTEPLFALWGWAGDTSFDRYFY